MSEIDSKMLLGNCITPQQLPKEPRNNTASICISGRVLGSELAFASPRGVTIRRNRVFFSPIARREDEQFDVSASREGVTVVTVRAPTRDSISKENTGGSRKPRYRIDLRPRGF